MKTNLLSMLLIFAIALSACEKEKLTKETQSGENTFSCKINGKVYKAKTDLFSEAITGGIYLRQTSKYELSIAGSMYNGRKSDYVVGFRIPEFTSVGIFNLAPENMGYVYLDMNGTQYNTKFGKEGNINIKFLDYSRKICSGTFEFVATNTNDPNDKIYITDGRFDIKNKN